MKLSEIIEKLQECHATYGNIDFCVEAREPGDKDEIIGNDFVSLDFHKDFQGDYVCLVTDTKR